MSTVRLDSPKCGIWWCHTGENEGDDKVDMAGQVGHELHKGDPVHPDQVGMILANHSFEGQQHEIFSIYGFFISLSNLGR